MNISRSVGLGLVIGGILVALFVLSSLSHGCQSASSVAPPAVEHVMTDAGVGDSL